MGSEKQQGWTAELCETASGASPVATWMGGLCSEKFLALQAAIELVLETQGLDLAGTSWMKPLGDGLYEFRLRHSEAEVRRMYEDASVEGPGSRNAILLRLFVHFHGDRVILLVNGYDKGRNNSTRYQQQQITKAKKMLRAWRRANR